MDSLSLQPDQDLEAPEFIGMARKLHGQVVVAAKISSPMMAAIRTDIIRTGERRGRRRGHHTAWRADYLLEIEQRWRRIPRIECLHQYVERTKSTLLILDVRCGSTIVQNSHWPDGQQETDLITVGNRIVMNDHGTECNSANMATVSARHALSRRYRRGFDNSDRAVMGDLGVLAEFKLPEEPIPRVSVTARSGGLWCGDVMRFRSFDGVANLVFGVRTFRPPDKFY
jgi:hypothetical protein